MKIYTRTGDNGTTGLFGGRRVDKDDSRVEAYGTIDESNSVIGLARAYGLPKDIDEVLAQVQHALFILGAEVATVPETGDKLLKMKLVDASDIETLEHAIDAAEVGLPPLRAFILPGGDQGAAALHLARTVTRRAERLLVHLAKASPVRNEVIIYLNRLSDLLFVQARRANHAKGIEDILWQAPQK